MLGDFNARSKSWWSEDIEQIKFLTTTYGLYHLILDPIHIPPNSSSCNYLIFTNQQNLVISSGVRSSLHPICHHQIIYCKFNLLKIIRILMNVWFGIIAKLIVNQSSELLKKSIGNI